MATTFSSGYKIKLIGTGLEAGTWGTSTNENFKRVDQYLSGFTQFDPASATVPSSWNSGTNVLTWCLGDTTDAGEAGDEARNRYIEFITTTGNITVNIRGSSNAETNVDRVYWVRNSLAGNGQITFDSGGSPDLVLQNGATALIYAAGGAVGNILGSLQADGLDFRTAASLIKLLTNNANSLSFEDPATSYKYLHFDTVTAAGANAEHVALGSTNVDTRIESDKVDLRSSTKSVFLMDGEAASLDIVEGYLSPSSYLKFVTTNGSEAVAVGQTLDIDTAEVNVGTQATDIVLKTDDAAALEFRETSTSGSRYLSFDTLTPKVLMEVELQVDGALDVDGAADFSNLLTATAGVEISGNKFGTSDPGTIDGTTIGLTTPAAADFTEIGVTTSNGIHMEHADAYINFDGTNSGTDYRGIRRSGTDLQVKNTNSDGWGQPYHAGMVNGQGGYFEATFDLDVSSNQNNGSAAHGFSSIPRIIRCVLVCESSSNGYSVGDEIDISSLASSDTGNNVDPSGATYGSDVNDVFYALAGTLRAFPKTGYTSGDSNPSVMSKGDWNLKIMAWK